MCLWFCLLSLYTVYEPQPAHFAKLAKEHHTKERKKTIIRIQIPNDTTHTAQINSINQIVLQVNSNQIAQAKTKTVPKLYRNHNSNFSNNINLI